MTKTITDRGAEGRVTAYGDRVVAQTEANARPAARAVHGPKGPAVRPAPHVAVITLYDPKAWLKGQLKDAVLGRLARAFNNLRARNMPQGFLAQQGIVVEARHVARMSTRDERFGTGRLDFPVYLLNAHTPDRTSPSQIRELMLDHGLRDSGLAGQQFAAAADAWEDRGVEGLGIQPLRGFKKVGFVKGDRVAAASKDQDAGFTNVILHELGHMSNLHLRDHSSVAGSVMREGILLAAGFLEYDEASQRGIVAHLLAMIARPAADLQHDYERQNP